MTLTSPLRILVASLVTTAVALTGAVVPASAQEAGTAAVTNVIVRFEDDAEGRPQFVSAQVTDETADRLLDHPLVTEIETVGAGAILESTPDPERANQWEYTASDIESVWNYSTGSANTVIAILDTGVNPDADFGDRLLPGASFTGGNAHDDPHGHGTGVALVAAAGLDNGIGGTGVCPECSILPVQVAGATGSVRWDDAAKGVLWAVDNGADVINLSFGGDQGSPILADSIQFAIEAGVIVVAASGNSGTPQAMYPAAFDGVISVGGHDRDLAQYGFSNYGDSVDVAAPGCVWVSSPAGSTRCGTSFASPIVAGLAALLQDAGAGFEATNTELTQPFEAASWTAGGPLDGGRVADALAQLTTTKEAPTTPELDPTTAALVEPTTTATIAAPDFTDVSANAYYADAVNWLATNGYSTGTTATTFSPDQPLTRAQAATLLYRTAGEPDTANNGTNFTDVSANAYYADAVNWLATNGYSTGTTATTFSPDQPLTRAQAATLLYRTAGQPA